MKKIIIGVIGFLLLILIIVIFSEEPPQKRENIYDDFSGSTLDTTKWQEVPGSDVNNLFVDEYFVDVSKEVYHTAHVTPSDRGITLEIIDHSFIPGEMLEYDLDYVSGSGNRISIVNLDDRTKHIGIIGYWNSVEPGGNDFGTYHIRVEFDNEGADVTITRPDNTVSTRRFDSPGKTHSFGVGTRTGHDGVVHMDYDNFTIIQ